jgi:hypothetical protein
VVGGYNTTYRKENVFITSKVTRHALAIDTTAPTVSMVNPLEDGLVHKKQFNLH